MHAKPGLTLDEGMSRSMLNFLE